MLGPAGRALKLEGFCARIGNQWNLSSSGLKIASNANSDLGGIGSMISR
jgi:hypothetical protein